MYVKWEGYNDSFNSWIKKRHWDPSTSSQDSNCDGFVLDVYLDHKFQEISRRSGICDPNKSPTQHHCSKKDVIWMSKHFPKPKSLRENVKVELDLSSYVTKADLKNGARVDTLYFA